MKLKQSVRYGMNFNGKSLSGSAFFAGLSFFLLVVYYYGFGRIGDVSGADMVFGVIVPLVLLGVYAVLLRGVRLNIPLVYLCIAALYCLAVIIISFGRYALWQDVIGVVWYVLCLGVLTVSVLGYFSGKWIAALGFLAAAGARFFLGDYMGYFSSEDLLAVLPETAILSGILSLAFMSGGLKDKSKK